MEKNIHKVPELQVTLHSLAEELSQLIVREHQILQGEMCQVRTLVSDAVKRLDSNFRSLNACASEQSAILDQVLESSRVDEVQRQKLSEISDKINAHTSTTIRVLQFDDIVQQLTGHACDRIARMQELFTELEDKLTNIKRLETMDENAIQTYINTMREEVMRFRAKLEKENPVRQNSMNEGKIEFF